MRRGWRPIYFRAALRFDVDKLMLRSKVSISKRQQDDANDPFLLRLSQGKHGNNVV